MVDSTQMVFDGVLDRHLALYPGPLGMSPLDIACMYGLREIVGDTWSGDIDLVKPETDGVTALYHASYNGHQEIVQKLIEFGANPNMELFFGSFSSERPPCMLPYGVDMEALFCFCCSMERILKSKIIMVRQP